MNEKISKERFLKEIQFLYDTFGRVDKNIFEEHSSIDINFGYYCHKYGGLKTILAELGIPFVYYNEKDIGNDAKDAAIKVGQELLQMYGLLRKDICTKNGLSSARIRKLFGNFQLFYEAVGYDSNFHRNVQKEDVIRNIQLVVDETQNTTLENYIKNGAYSKDVIRRLGGWPSLLIEIGKCPNMFCGNIEDMKRETVFVYNKYGFISAELITKECSFTYSAIRNHFNSIKDLCDFLEIPEDAFRYGRSSKERLISEFLNEILGKDSYFTEFTWDWLRSKNNFMFVDFYIPAKNLVIEYDGEQHYRMTKIFHKTQKDFENQKERDLLKDKLLSQHRINIRRIPYTQKITKECILSILSEY